MTPEITSLLIVLGVALVLFSVDWLSADVVGLAVLLALVLLGLVPPDRAFAGFGSDTVIMILGLLILVAALLRTGVVEAVGRAVLRRAANKPGRIAWMLTGSAAALSAFISNTAATAFFLPVALSLRNGGREGPARLLMPLAFSAIAASSVTLVSTSTNILISGLMTGYGLAPMGVFELAPVGIPIAVLGVAYMLTVGRRLTPDRTGPAEATERFGLRQYLAEARIPEGSSLAGKTVAESSLRQDVTLLKLSRGNGHRFVPRATTRLEEGDVLLIEGEPEAILKVKELPGVEIRGDAALSDPDLQTEEIRLAEIIPLPQSPLIGRSPRSPLLSQYGLQVLAVARHGGTIVRHMGQIRLKTGDVMLVQGARESIAALEEDDTLRVLGGLDERRVRSGRAPVAVAIFAGVLLLAAFKLVPLPVAVLLGSVGVFLARCITPQEAYREVEWTALILIGSMLAVGTAMEHTGTARFLASRIVDATANLAPVWLLSAFFGLTVLLTQPMSNQAAAVVVLPVAIQTALQLGLNARTFAMMIAVAASCSFLTPLEPACLLVYGPGRYRFLDFPRVGALLTVLIYVVAILLVPSVWPL